jgi:hypothetical protein
MKACIGLVVDAALVALEMKSCAYVDESLKMKFQLTSVISPSFPHLYAYQYSFVCVLVKARKRY